MSRLRQLIFNLLYPVLRYKMHQKYVISTAKVDQAKREFSTAVSEIEKLLNQRQYLVGSQFTRADLSVASMLSLLVMPPEHPFPWKKIPDPQTRAFLNEFQDHPVSEWVRNMYKDHRSRERV